MQQEGGEFGVPLPGACAAGWLSVVELLVSKEANSFYVNKIKMYRAFRAARSFQEIRQ